MGYVILIVDDDPAMGELLGKVLSRRGYLTFIANSASEALSVFEKEQVDLVLTDLDLPETNGFQLLGQLKALRADVPVVLMTSFGNHEQGLRAHEEGACYFLSKPLNMDTIVSCIERLLFGLERPAAQHPGLY
jgi:DNA-binding NtrC family response regulator